MYEMNEKFKENKMMSHVFQWSYNEVRHQALKPPLDIEVTPLKTSTPASRIAPPALIKGRVNESLPFCWKGLRARIDGLGGGEF